MNYGRCYFPCGVCVAKLKLPHASQGGSASTVLAMAANIPSVEVDGEEGLLDLSFLTKEEREKLQAVLRADEDLKIRDRIRLG